MNTGPKSHGIPGLRTETWAPTTISQNEIFADLQRGESVVLGWEEAGVLGDAYHGKYLGEVRGEAESIDLLAGVRSFDEHLYDEGNAARVDVINLGEVEQDELGCFLGQRLVAAEHRIFGGAGDVALEAEGGHIVPGWGSQLVYARFGLALHDLVSP